MTIKSIILKYVWHEVKQEAERLSRDALAAVKAEAEARETSLLAKNEILLSLIHI